MPDKQCCALQSASHRYRPPSSATPVTHRRLPSSQSASPNPRPRVRGARLVFTGAPAVAHLSRLFPVRGGAWGGPGSAGRGQRRLDWLSWHRSTQQVSGTPGPRDGTIGRLWERVECHGCGMGRSWAESRSRGCCLRRDGDGGTHIRYPGAFPPPLSAAAGLRTADRSAGDLADQGGVGRGTS